MVSTEQIRTTDPAARLRTRVHESGVLGGATVVRQRPEVTALDIVEPADEVLIDGEAISAELAATVPMLEIIFSQDFTDYEEPELHMERTEVYEFLSQPHILETISIFKSWTVEKLLTSLELLDMKNLVDQNPHLAPLFGQDREKIVYALTYMRDQELSISPTDTKLSDLDRIVLRIKHLHVSSNNKTATQLLNAERTVSTHTGQAALMGAVLRFAARL